MKICWQPRNWEFCRYAGQCLLILEMFILLSHPLTGQSLQYHFKHLTIEDGLSQNTVLSIVQDDAGYMWIGTPDGLNRFDGNQVKRFRWSAPDSFLTDNYIQSLGKDDDGFIWLGTGNGSLAKLDPVTTRIEDVYRVTLGIAIHCLLPVEDRLIAGTWGKGLYLVNPELDSISPVIPELASAKISSLARGEDGVIWVGTMAGLFRIRFTGEGYTFREFRFEPGFIAENTKMNTVIQGRDGELWVGTGAGLIRIEGDTSVKRYRLQRTGWESVAVNTIVEDGEYLVLGLENLGLVILHKPTETLQYISHNSTIASSLAHDTVVQLYQDASGGIWVGTWGAGVDRFTLTPDFRHINTMRLNDYSLSGKSVRAIVHTDDSTLWVGSYGGLDRFNLNQKRKQHYDDKPGELKNRNVYCFFPDESFLWIGTEGGGLHRLNIATGRMDYYPHPAGAPGKNFIFSLTAFGPDKILIGSLLGMDIFDRTRQEYVDWKSREGMLDPIHSEKIQTILYQGEEIWAGSADNGIFRFFLTGDSITGFTHYTVQSKNGLTTNRIKCIIADGNQKIWIGTNGGGLSLFAAGNFVHYSEKDGLKNNVVYGICADNHNRLWLSTNNGISLFYPQRGSFVNFLRSYGLQENEFNTGAYYTDQKGNLYFGGINGITQFHPDQIVHDTMPAPVVTEIHLSNKPDPIPGYGYDRRSGDSLPLNNQLELQANREHITFVFSAFDYQDNARLEYAYILDGLDKSWTTTAGSQPVATYTHLPSGDFTFRVKARHVGAALWSPAATLSLQIPVPLWLRWWSLLFYFLLGSGMIISTFRYFNQRQARALEKEQEKILQMERMARLKEDMLQNRIKYQMLFQQSVDPIFIIDRQGHFMDLNLAGRQMLEWGDRHLPVAFFDYFADDAIREKFESEIRQKGSIRDYDVVLKTANQHSIYVQITASELKNRKHEVIGCQGIIRNVTQIRKAQEKIQRLSLGIEAAGEAVFMTDLDANIIYINPAFHRLTGYTREDVIGETPSLLKSGKHDTAFYQDLWATLKKGQTWTGEITNRRKNGTIYTASTTIAPWRDQGDIIQGYVAIQTDLSRRMAMEKTLKQSHQAYQQLAQKLLVVQDAERERISRDIHDSLGQYLSTLVVQNDILQQKITMNQPEIFSSLEESRALLKEAIYECRRLSFELNPLSLQRLGLVQAIRELLSAVKDRSKINFVFEDLTERYPLKSEMSTALYRVLQEAISNILKYSSASEVGIHLIIDRGKIRLEIKDDGVGFQPEKIKPMSLKRGFGLINMRERIAGLQGELTIISALGKGCYIRAEIPLYKS